MTEFRDKIAGLNRNLFIDYIKLSNEAAKLNHKNKYYLLIEWNFLKHNELKRKVLTITYYEYVIWITLYIKIILIIARKYKKTKHLKP